ncbi:hypothetical protein PFISCL1PPCAC_4012, partial [Pristionchus fissidentatus]
LAPSMTTSLHRPTSAHFTRRAPPPSPLEMSLPGMPLSSSSAHSSPAPYSPSICSTSPVQSPNSTSASSTHSLGPVRVSPISKTSITPPNRNRSASLNFGPGDRFIMNGVRTGPQPARMPLGTRHSDSTQVSTPSRRRRVSIDENYETTAQFIEQMRKELIKQL